MDIHPHDICLGDRLASDPGNPVIRTAHETFCTTIWLQDGQSLTYRDVFTVAILRTDDTN